MPFFPNPSSMFCSKNICLKIVIFEIEDSFIYFEINDRVDFLCQLLLSTKHCAIPKRFRNVSRIVLVYWCILF